MKDITVDVTYLRGNKAYFMNLKSIERVYGLSSTIIKFHYFYSYSRSFVFEKHRNEPRKLLEEMIHDCLPAPDEYFTVTKTNKDYRWKYHLLDMLFVAEESLAQP